MCFAVFVFVCSVVCLFGTKTKECLGPDPDPVRLQTDCVLLLISLLVYLFLLSVCLSVLKTE